MINICDSPLQQRYIGNTPVGRVYIGDNLVWETKEGYGVRWVHAGDGTITRIGNMEYHRQPLILTLVWLIYRVRTAL